MSLYKVLYSDLEYRSIAVSSWLLHKACKDSWCHWDSWVSLMPSDTLTLQNLSSPLIDSIKKYAIRWFRNILFTCATGTVFMDRTVCVGFPGGSVGKESTYIAGDLGSIPGSERSPGGGHGNPFQYSCLENPHGQKSLAGCSLWGCKELDMTGRLSTAPWWLRR